MNNKTIAVLAVVAAIVIASTIALTANDSAFATRKKTETTAQQNSCGNDTLPLNILCQNAGSQVQGRDNLVVVNATQ